ncbi:DUF502 domain-containing protein [Limnobacter humi]|uniref:DUF502 domain-containing protein n=1 Tax=Limnobacter humi TaxID=1778671 RepID=A0ABT1WCM3_9BURK|nr:DUF502 domain-containing protein [Limnobacter humi]MCQ8895273.1 DUF502 domain-containing protein [Limnobacter humi]
MKKLLLAGLLVWVPLLITAWVLLTVVGLVDKTLLLLPAALQPESLFGFYVPGLGFVLTFLVLLVTGLLYTNFIGAWLFRLGDRILSGIPLLKVVYTSVKQISDTLLTSSGKAFRESVLVPYPHPGVWALGFVTGNPPDNLASSFEDRMVAVYVPTAPSPASGYVIIVPENSLRPSGMTVDEALKYIVSLGVVTPPGEAAL